jgi:hypothetical protein
MNPNLAQTTTSNLTTVNSHNDRWKTTTLTLNNKHRKALHIMFRGSWDIMSQRIIKTLHREIMAAASMPRAAPHHKWMETPIGFDSSGYPKNMEGARQLPLLVSLTIANIKWYHVLINEGAALNPISLTTFKKMLIPMGKL